MINEKQIARQSMKKKLRKREFLRIISKPCAERVLLNYVNCFNTSKTLFTNPPNKHAKRQYNIQEKGHEICSNLTIKTAEKRH